MTMMRTTEGTQPGDDLVLLRTENLDVAFRSTRGPVHAVDHVDLELLRGEVLAIVGESGSGKSALTRAAIGAIDPRSVAYRSGRISFDGLPLSEMSRDEVRRLWGRRIAVVSQNPLSSLNPVMQIGAQIGEVLTKRLSMRRAAARVRIVELLDAVGIPDPRGRLHDYPHQLSGGMRQRVAIAMALAGEPDLLIADEPTTALDVTIQAQIVELLRQLNKERGMTLVFVSHDLALVAGIADRVAVMYGGRLVELGPVDDVVYRPRMPYTAALLRSTPHLDSDRSGRLPTIPGRPPDLVGDRLGCPFAPRCERATAECSRIDPPLTVHGSRSFACHHPLEEVTSDGRKR